MTPKAFFFMLSGLSTVFSAATGGELLNRNSEMELGLIGRGVPAYQLIVNRIGIPQVRKTPDKVYFAQTAKGGNPGLCLEIPGYEGVSHYQLELGNFTLTRDGEVEISFDAKIGPDENGKWQTPKTYSIDFRLFPNMDIDRYYPMLECFRFAPGKEWTHFSKRFKVKAYSHYYNISVQPNGISSQGTGNSLYLDNFRFEYTNSDPAPANAEYAIHPDREDQLYRPGETVRYTVRARLSGKARDVSAQLRILREYNHSLLAERPVILTCGENGTYSGMTDWTVPEFGSFTTELQIPDQKLQGVNTVVTALHPEVRHPELSPGWGLGCNDEGLCPFGRANSDCVDNYLLHVNGFERKYRLLRKSGVSLLRVWGIWRQIEPEKGKFTADIIGLQMDILKKYDVTPLFCLVGNFTVHGGKETIEKWQKRGNQPYPAYLLDYYYEPPKNTRKMGSIIPPPEVYARYLDFVLKTWGDRTRFWEMSNEPGIFGFPAKNYLEYLKYTYGVLKKRAPENYLLGNGVTGDFGMNVVKWCEQLNEADSNYVQSLDGIAFHPYNRALDDMNNLRDLYQQCIASIRGTLKQERPLWCTECYYLPTMRRKQMNHYLEQERFGANEILRHFLDGKLDGVVASPSLSPGSYFFRTDDTVHLPCLNEVAAAQNTLSFLLDGMDSVQEVPLGRFVRAGMFKGKNGRALGFLYDRRILGSEWTPGPANGVKTLDLFGNEKTGKAHPLSWEPYFLTGPEKEVEKALKLSEFKVRYELQVRARQAGQTLFLEAENIIEKSGEFKFPCGDKTLVFRFSGQCTYARLTIDAPEKLPENIRLVSNTNFYHSGDIAKLDRGTTARLSNDAQKLRIELDIADANLQPTPTQYLWDGSSVEVFLDAEPDKLLATDVINPYRYAFGALPPKTGAAVWSSRFPAKGTRTVEYTGNGYRMIVEIPFSELPTSDVYGIEIEINRQDGKSKETLGGLPGQSFRRRLHYSFYSLK